MKLLVPSAFIEYRTDKSELYNKRGRSEEQFLMDLDCELYEWTMIQDEVWLDEDDWRVDATVPDPNGYKRIDCKFIKKWYNISNVKMHNIIQQRHILDGYQFNEWIDRPARPLQAGDTVELTTLGYIPYDDLLGLIQVSRGKWGGFYADVRTYLS